MEPKQRLLTQSAASGFTLMEVILAIVIVSFIMVSIYATLFTTISARDQIEEESLKGKVGPAILDLIERDVNSVWCMNIHDNDVFFGEDFTINGEHADTIHMITTTDSTMVEMNDEEPVRSDLTEVSYRLRQNPTAPEMLELLRRQDFHVDEEIVEGGLYEIIYSRIKSFRILYLDDIYEGAEKFEDWDAKKRNRLPAAMEIFMSLEIDPRLAGYDLDDMERPTLDYHRLIYFPAGSALTMAVRPVVPTFVDPNAASEEGGGGGGGGGGKGGGGGGDGTGGRGDGDMGGKGNDLRGGNRGPGGGDGFTRGDGAPGLDFNNPPQAPPGGGGDVNLQDLLDLLNGKK